MADSGSAGHGHAADKRKMYWLVSFASHVSSPTEGRTSFAETVELFNSFQ